MHAFTYIFREPNVVEHLKNIEQVINNLETNIKSDIEYIFVPFIKGLNININMTIEQHNAYDKIKIVNIMEFVKYIKEKLNFSLLEQGKFIFGLNKIFYSYQENVRNYV